MQQIFLVFIGGGVGSALRYIIGLKLNQETIPYGTLTVNFLGSLLIGLLMGYYLKTANHTLTENQIAFMAVGVFGGFTTFSSFMYENLQFLFNEQYFRFVGYTILSLSLGFLAVFLGFLWGKNI
ncbi:MAG TPA: fluoride efflux transporter CrcB [Saprospiraceae bacterium]|nr:fluoride efflux transporter CrcB [Saprospiraceae bacterium]